MARFISEKHLVKQILPTALAVALGLAGCGGSDSSTGTTTSGTTPDGNNGGNGSDGNGDGPQKIVLQRVSLTGFAVDPYIASAHLCADLDKNQRCDAGEPRGMTNGEGEFDLGDWPDGFQEVQILVENQGSWQVPQYGLHQGKPYGMPMSIVIHRDVEVASATSPLPPVLMTPATTLQANYGLTEAQVLAIVNQFQTQIGREITADDLLSDPVSLFGKTPVADLENEDLAVFRVYLALYATNRILSSLQSLADGLGDQFAARLTDSNSAEYRVIEITLDSIARATAPDVLVASQQQIDAGQQQMDDDIRAQTPDQFESFVLADVPDFPALTADVVMAIGVTIIEFELNRTQALVTELFNAGNSTFDQIAEAAADQLEADFQDGGTGSQLEDHIPTLGVRTYGLINKAHFLNYQSRSYVQGTPANMGELVFNGIVAASPDLALGFSCDSAGFFAFDEDDNIDTTCTSALPTDLQQKLAGFNGSAEAPDEENSPVDQDVWGNIPVGQLLVSDQPVDQTCSLSGTVYYTPQGGDAPVPAPAVPLYLVYGASNQEINVVTDNNGNFSFNRIPAKKYAADGWPEDEATGNDHYFFGVIAGKRRPVPEYYEYEANADYHFNCRLPLPTDNGGVAGAGGEGARDGDDNLVFASAEVEVYPLIKPLVDSTEIRGVVAAEMLGDGFGMEVHSKLRTYSEETTSSSVYDGGWIMDAVELETPENQHPFTDYDDSTGAFDVRALAGGIYSLRPHFSIEGTNDAGEAATLVVECQSDELTVPAGQITQAEMQLVEVAEGEESNCYYAEGKAGQYEKSLLISAQ